MSKKEENVYYYFFDLKRRVFFTYVPARDKNHVIRRKSRMICLGIFY